MTIALILSEGEFYEKGDQKMPLCTFCKSLPMWLMPRFYDMFESKYPNYRLPRFWMHQPSWNALQTSAQTCEFCALIETESERERDTQAQKSMNNALNDGPASPAIRFCAYAGGRLEDGSRSRVMHHGSLLSSLLLSMMVPIAKIQMSCLGRV